MENKTQKSFKAYFHCGPHYCTYYSTTICNNFVLLCRFMLKMQSIVNMCYVLLQVKEKIDMYII